jgi:hypothetical protein
MEVDVPSARSDAPGVVISTYLRPDVAAVVRARASAADRTVAAEVRRTITRCYMDNLALDAGESRPTPGAAT